MSLRTLLQKALGVSSPDRAAIASVKTWARAAFDGPPDTVFAVNEIACTDPACPGVETVILVMAPGLKTRACKISKGLDAVSEEDVRLALDERGGSR